MPRLIRRCRDCGASTKSGNRCGRCTEAGRDRPAFSARYGSGWQRVRLEVLERDNYSCYWCEAPANTVDHLVPVSHGGTQDPDLLVAACGRCNYGRGNRARPAS